MVWPYDAVKTTYGSLQPVASADLNDWQARIVDLHRERQITDVPAETEVTQWEWLNQKWVAVGVGSVLDFFIRAQNGFRLKKAEVKYYGNGATAPTMTLIPRSVKFDAPATAPADEAALATYNTASSGAWTTASLTPAATELAAADRTFYVHVLSGQAGDCVGGIRATFEPITPTP